MTTTRKRTQEDLTRALDALVLSTLDSGRVVSLPIALSVLREHVGSDTLSDREASELIVYFVTSRGGAIMFGQDAASGPAFASPPERESKSQEQGL